ncbi:factor H binding protein domain-containing protein [Pseudothauera rhizosphaerae]|uniref:Factor H binding protein-like C-terminal domain-containing protein n=1 Tax=Pseudothauera rhizosphaerae TaxID=2565932 RepID=A0A4S4AQP6_9RHOO|nr:factor H binding protein domain-containing protein [Pseudothauera rhizosphaerae]THF62054.1 hypothetical protein E6O51_07795 [Pseudothauera rhizosphaerae]
MKTTFKLTAVAALVAASLNAVAADSDFQFSSIDPEDFVFRGSAVYQGAFDYNGVTYSAGSAFDLTQLPDGDTRLVKQVTVGGALRNAIFRFYKQDYSIVVGNTLQADLNRSFVKDIVGLNTAESALPTSGSYTYTGVVFNHNDKYTQPGTGATIINDGQFSYTIDLAARTGSGTVSNIRGNRPVYGEFELNGTLHTAAIAVQADGTLGVKNGNVTLTTDNLDLEDELAAAGPKYDLGIFGPNAEEVAGRIHGLSDFNGIGGYALVGKR